MHHERAHEQAAISRRSVKISQDQSSARSPKFALIIYKLDRSSYIVYHQQHRAFA